MFFTCRIGNLLGRAQFGKNIVSNQKISGKACRFTCHCNKSCSFNDPREELCSPSRSNSFTSLKNPCTLAADPKAKSRSNTSTYTRASLRMIWIARSIASFETYISTGQIPNLPVTWVDAFLHLFSARDGHLHVSVSQALSCLDEGRTGTQS